MWCLFMAYLQFVRRVFVSLFLGLGLVPLAAPEADAARGFGGRPSFGRPSVNRPVRDAYRSKREAAPKRHAEPRREHPQTTAHAKSRPERVQKSERPERKIAKSRDDDKSKRSDDARKHQVKEPAPRTSKAAETAGRRDETAKQKGESTTKSQQSPKPSKPVVTARSSESSGRSNTTSDAASRAAGTDAASRTNGRPQHPGSDGPPKRTPETKPTWPNLSLVAALAGASCVGGRVLHASCGCPEGLTRHSVGNGQFVCGVVSCAGGTASRRSCECAAGVKRREYGAGRFACGNGPIVPAGLPPLVGPLPQTATYGGQALTDGSGSVSTTQASAGPPNSTPTKAASADAPAALPPPPPAGPTAPRARPPVVQIPTVAQAGRTYVPDEIVISVNSATPQSVEDGVAQRYRLQLIERTPLTLLGQRLVRYRIPDRRSVPAVLAALLAEPGINERQPNYIYRRQQGAARPEAPSMQYALAKVGLASDDDAKPGRGVVIGIIDTGVDPGHPDLMATEVVSFDATSAGGDMTSAHGTAIAGIIAAKGTVRGIAPFAKILSARAFTPQKASLVPTSTSYMLAKSFDWTVANGARVLNLSFAGPADPLIQKVVSESDTRNVVMVAAAGNGGRKAAPAYPGAYPEVIAVTATDAADRIYENANQGAYIALAAPGVDILVATKGRGHDLESGTSFAAAHISGIVALIIERNPRIPTTAVRGALISTATDLGMTGRDDAFGAGLVNAPAALKLATSWSK
jgi:Subtilase family